MIIGVGIDIQAIGKLDHLISTLGKSFTDSVFTKRELKYANEHQGIHNLATSFSGKEAFIKAVGGISLQNFSLKNIEILRLPSGQPYIVLHRPIKTIYSHHKFFLSQSFTEDMASAIVIVEKT